MACRHERHVALPGAKNFRDIGGYRTAAGNRVTMFKHLYRSDTLSNVTPKGAELMTGSLHIRYAIDLRAQEEVELAPYSLPDIERVAIPMRPDSLFEAFRTRKEMNKTDAETLLHAFASNFYTHYKAQVKEVFDVLLNTVRGAVAVVHCTQGKDRTGAVIALLLQVLGVPLPTIREDFMLSNVCATPSSCGCTISGCNLSADAVNVFLLSQSTFLEAALNGLQERYGSIDAYVAKELGLTPTNIETLRTYYTRASYSQA